MDLSELHSQNGGGSSDEQSFAAPSTQDALALLSADHRRIDDLFGDIERLGYEASSAADRSGLLARLGGQLRVHIRIKQEIFYPALAASGAADAHTLADAEADHEEILARLENLAQLDSMDEEGATATVAQDIEVLAQLVRAHITEEQKLLFRQARSLDLQTLGTQMALRQGELMADQGVD